MDVLAGLILVVLGVVLAASGLRIWFVALPILGFIAGMTLGLEIMYYLFDKGFLTTTIGFILGLVLGVVFAAVSYLYWYIGAILGAAFFGAAAGSGLLAIFGADSKWVLGLAALVGALLFAYAAVALDLPIYMVIVNTAFAGATMAVAGVMLVFDQVDRGQLGNGAVAAAWNEHWWWVLIWVAVAAVGLAAQLQMIAQVTLPTERYTRTRMPGAI
jgi:hypothetical protein